MNKLFIVLFFSIMSLQGWSHGEVSLSAEHFERAVKTKKAWVSLGSDLFKSLKSQKLIKKLDFIKKTSKGVVIALPEGLLSLVSGIAHTKFKRCGGVVRHNSESEARDYMLELEESADFSKSFKFNDYQIDQNKKVKSLMKNVKAKNIEKVIRKLSSYKNRHYKSKTGVASSLWIKKEWERLSKMRSDVSVKAFKHDKWPQPSIIMTVDGNSSETIIIGGHADSIAGIAFQKHAKAPGADDNASGIATITEVIRIMMSSGYKPEKTIKFMAYAAEEVGLLGSKEIAKKMKNEGADIVGVLQLDMTNYMGSKDFDVVLISDFTNRDQNKFLGKLLDEYLPSLKWGYDKCGYACSDHASWHKEGYPASTPFEAKKNNMNKKIHTKRDTIDLSGGNANHAEKFAKLALAYLVELDR